MLRDAFLAEAVARLAASVVKAAGTKSSIGS
jgi:hypothetical protein